MKAKLETIIVFASLCVCVQLAVSDPAEERFDLPLQCVAWLMCMSDCFVNLLSACASLQLGKQQHQSRVALEWLATMGLEWQQPTVLLHHYGPILTCVWDVPLQVSLMWLILSTQNSPFGKLDVRKKWFIQSWSTYYFTLSVLNFYWSKFFLFIYFACSLLVVILLIDNTAKPKLE